jgi:hypothetical protein
MRRTRTGAFGPIRRDGVSLPPTTPVFASVGGDTSPDPHPEAGSGCEKADGSAAVTHEGRLGARVTLTRCRCIDGTARSEALT